MNNISHFSFSIKRNPYYYGVIGNVLLSENLFIFTGNGSITLSNVNVRILAVGGGGGGSLGNGPTGGGGGGGVVELTRNITNQTTITVNIGKGGYRAYPSVTTDNYGGNTTAVFTNGYSNIIAGGGAPGGIDPSIVNVLNYSGSGGGAPRLGNSLKGGIGKASNYNFANSGGSSSLNSSWAGAGGGGGAGGVGKNGYTDGTVAGEVGGDGGIGYLSDITGKYLYWAGGGGAGTQELTSTPGKGGLGGGGAGRNQYIYSSSNNGLGGFNVGLNGDGGINTGGGGGGAKAGNPNGDIYGNGGSGIFIIKILQILDTLNTNNICYDSFIPPTIIYESFDSPATLDNPAIATNGISSANPIINVWTITTESNTNFYIANGNNLTTATLPSNITQYLVIRQNANTTNAGTNNIQKQIYLNSNNTYTLFFYVSGGTSYSTNQKYSINIVQDSVPSNNVSLVSDASANTNNFSLQSYNFTVSTDGIYNIIFKTTMSATSASISNLLFTGIKLIYNISNTNANYINNLFTNVKPWGIYDASLWNGWFLPEARGIGRNVDFSGNILFNRAISGNGAVAKIPSISGNISGTLTWPNGSVPLNYTICAITRYTDPNGTSTTNQRKILQYTSGSTRYFTFGHFSSQKGLLYDGDGSLTGWKTSQAGTTTNLTNWLVMCGKKSTGTGSVLSDRFAIGTNNPGTGNVTLSINTTSDQTSNWALTYLVIYDSVLTDAQMTTVSNKLTNYKYFNDFTEKYGEYDVYLYDNLTENTNVTFINNIQNVIFVYDTAKVNWTLPQTLPYTSASYIFYNLRGHNSAIFFPGGIYRGYPNLISRFTFSNNVWSKYTEFLYNLPTVIPTTSFTDLSASTFPGCWLWLDANDATKVSLTSGQVLGWTDKSTNAFQFNSGTNKPTLTTNALNGRPVINFVASNQNYLAGPQGENTSSFKIGGNSIAMFYVFKYTNSTPKSGGDFDTVFSKSLYVAAGGRLLLTRGSTGTECTLTQNSADNGLSVFQDTSTSYRIFSMVANRVTDKTLKLYINGTETQSVTMDNTINYTDTYRMFVGAYNDNSTPYANNIISTVNSYLNGSVAEIIGYSNTTDMSTTTRQYIEGYLAWKWGLQTNLPTSHPYYIISPKNFNNTNIMNNLISGKSPWGIYDAAYWNPTTKILPEARGITAKDANGSGTIYSGSASGNGAIGNISYIGGDTTCKMYWPTSSITAGFTICSITRYSGASKKRILTTSRTTFNWYHGHYNGNIGTAYYNKPISGSVGHANTDWLTMCGNNGNSIYANIFANSFYTGGGPGAIGGSAPSAPITINDIGDYPSEVSDWEFVYMVIWDQILGDDEMVYVSGKLSLYLNTGSMA